MRLLSDQRGVAMSEGLILATFFTFILGGVLYLKGYYGDRLADHALVRDCAWAHAMNGCKAGANPCANVTAHPELKRTNLDDKVDEARGVGAGVEKLSGFVHKVLDALHVFGEQTTLRTTFSERPKNGNASFAVFCNEQPREPLDVIGDAFTSFFKF